MPGISVSKIPIPFKRAGISWSSYWATRTPSALVLAPQSGTQINTTWTDALQAADGLVLEISTDEINWTVAATVAFGVQASNVTGLTINTRYYFRLSAYMGSNNSSYIYNDNYTAKYFVNAAGSSTAPYDTFAKGHTSIQTVATYIANNEDGSGCVMSIGAGTFSEYIYLLSANQDNLIVAGRGETTIINKGTSHSIYHTNADNVTVCKLNSVAPIGYSAYYSTNAGKSATMYDMLFSRAVGHAKYCIYSTGNHITVRDSIIYGQLTSGQQVYLTNAANGTFERVISIAEGSAKYVNGSWSFETTGTVNINHCNILDSGSWGLYFSANGTFNVKNSIVTGGYQNTASYPIGRTNGTLTLTKNLIFSSIRDADAKWISGTWVDGGGNIFNNIDPKFKTYPRKGYILPRGDDGGNEQYAYDLGNLLASYGYSGSYYIGMFAYKSANEALVRSMVQTGNMEIGTHAYSHSDMSCTGKIFDVTKGAETITVDRTADTITLSGGGSVTGFKAKKLSDIKTELEGLGATVTPSAIYGGGTGEISTYALGEVIDDEVASNEIKLLIDITCATGYFKSEFVDSIALLENVVNGGGDIIDAQTGNVYECRTYEAPFGQGSVDARTALINIGLLGAGQRDVLNYYGGYWGWMGSFDAYAIGAVPIEWLKGATEAETRACARLFAFMCAHTGYVMSILSHNTAGATMEEWGWILEEFSAFGDNINVCSKQKFLDEVKAVGSPWTDEGDGTYTRTMGYGDYELETDSPLIGQADDSGNIGAY